MAGFVNVDKVLYSNKVTTDNGGKLHGTQMLMRSDLMELEPATGEKKDKRSPTSPRKGLARCELTVGRTNKKTGRAEVYGKAGAANIMFGWLVYDSYRRVWHYQLAKWKMPSALAFSSKKSAAIALGKHL